MTKVLVAGTRGVAVYRPGLGLVHEKDCGVAGWAPVHRPGLAPSVRDGAPAAIS